MGVGVPEEKRFGNLIAQDLGLVHYDFSIVGKDFSCVTHNILIFLNQCFEMKEFPKHIIILWPDIARFTWHECPAFFTELPNTVKEYSWQSNFIGKWDSKVSLVYLMQCMRSIELLCKSHGINLLQQTTNDLNFTHDLSSLIYCPEIRNPQTTQAGRIYWDQGRDGHFGPITHRKLADSYLKFIV